MWCGSVRVGVVVGALLVLLGSLTSSGCIRRVGQPSAAPATSQAASTISTHALPVFRLVTSEVLIDAPSRLLVLQVRLEGGGDAAAYAFALQDLTVTLPDGTQARVFDRARAIELLRRTTIADADFGYLLRDGHAPGGIAEYSRAQISDMVAGRLLSNGVFGAGQALQGYAVVDIGTARMSLDGTVVDVIANRVDDFAPARASFQLTSAPTAGAAR
jgi:hypothetical protein